MLASFAPAGSPAGASALVCNGKWHLQSASDLHDDVFLQAVSAISVSCAWAMGSFADGTGPLQPLFQHWDGTSWSVVPGADVGTASFLFAVSATPTGTVWAVGSYTTGGPSLALTDLWRGSGWRQVQGVSPGTSVNQLHGVAALSGKGVFAVGWYDNSDAHIHPLTEYFC